MIRMDVIAWDEAKRQSCTMATRNKTAQDTGGVLRCDLEH